MQLHALWGVLKAFRSRPSVLHVTSVIDAGPGTGFRCIRIRPGSPRSTTDQDLLEASRASSTTIITSGEILRQESRMTTRFDGARFAAEFDYVPTTIILTRSGRISLDHPALVHAPGPVKILSDHRLQLPRSLRDRGVGVVPIRPGTTITEIVSTLRRGRERISLEAGPTTTAPLYQAKQIDAILLSRLHGAPGREFVGAPTIHPDQLRCEFAELWRLDPGTDPWTFSFHVRSEWGRFMTDRISGGD